MSWKYKCERRPERKTGKWWGHKKEKAALHLESSPSLSLAVRHEVHGAVSLQVEDATTPLVWPEWFLLQDIPHLPIYQRGKGEKGFPFEMQLESP